MGRRDPPRACPPDAEAWPASPMRSRRWHRLCRHPPRERAADRPAALGVSKPAAGRIPGLGSPGSASTRRALGGARGPRHEGEGAAPRRRAAPSLERPFREDGCPRACARAPGGRGGSQMGGRGCSVADETRSWPRTRAVISLDIGSPPFLLVAPTRTLCSRRPAVKPAPRASRGCATARHDRVRPLAAGATAEPRPGR
jgi:hypothetical protein